MNHLCGWTEINYISKRVPPPNLFFPENIKYKILQTTPVQTWLPRMTSHCNNRQMLSFKHCVLCIGANISTCSPTHWHTAHNITDCLIHIHKRFMRSATWNSFCTAGIQSIERLHYEGACMYQCHPQTRSPAEALYRWHTFACDLAKGLLHTRDVESDFQLVFQGIYSWKCKKNVLNNVKGAANIKTVPCYI